MTPPPTFRSQTFSLGALLWPQLLAAARLAIRPARVAMAAILLLLIALLLWLPDLWLPKDATPAFAIHGHTSESMLWINQGFASFDLSLIFAGVGNMFIALPLFLVEHYPLSLLAILPFILLTWSIFGGAIARSAAEEFSKGTRQPWTRSLAFALSRPWSLFFSIVAPLALAVGIALVVAALGYVFFRLPGVNIAGGVAYGALLIAGLLLFLVILAFVMGQVLLIPAVACEGVDAIDATQRTFAYSLGRPFRTAFYLLVLLLQGLLLAVLLNFIVKNVVHLTADLATAWLPPAPEDAIHHAATWRTVKVPEDRPFGLGASSHLVSLWSAIPGLFAGAILLSFYFSGSSVMYLLLRRVCDGQDPMDLWFPGQAAGTISHVPAAGDPITRDDADEM